MKSENKTQKKATGQNYLKSKLMIIGITVIGTFILSGCQETSMVRSTSLPNLSHSDEKIYTMAEFSSEYGVYENETPQTNTLNGVYMAGTKAYAEKLMSMCENSDTHILNPSTSHLSDQVNGSVPILIILF